MKIDDTLFVELEDYLTKKHSIDLFKEIDENEGYCQSLQTIDRHDLDILKDFKENGGDRLVAFATISALIKKYEHDEKIYDEALEIADIIWGYCSRRYDIWEGSLHGLWPPTEGL